MKIIPNFYDLEKLVNYKLDEEIFLAKLHEVSDKKLEIEIRKYLKILHKLEKEAQRRKASGSDFKFTFNLLKDIVYTSVKEPMSQETKTSDEFQLTLDDENFQEIENIQKSNSKAQEIKEAEEEVRVTQLIKLNKKDLNKIKITADKKDEKSEK